MDNHYIVSWAEGQSQAVTWVVKSKRRETFFLFLKQVKFCVWILRTRSQYVVKEYRLCNKCFVCIFAWSSFMDCVHPCSLFFILPWRVWAFSTCRIVDVSARKRVLSWTVLFRKMLKLQRCSLAVSLAASPTAILAEHISLNNVTNGVSNPLEQGCVGVLYFTQVLEPRNPSGCLRPHLSRALLAGMMFNEHSSLQSCFSRLPVSL